MTTTDFYNQLAIISLTAPNFEIAQFALQLQTAIDNLNNEQYDDFNELFD